MSENKLTPLMQAIELIWGEKMFPLNENDKRRIGYNEGVNMAIKTLISLLSTEREVIKQSFRDGCNEVNYCMDIPNCEPITPTKYFDKTFKTE